MREADKTANILFHAAMAIGSGLKGSVVSAIFDACKYLESENMHSHLRYTLWLYGTLYGHSGDAWPVYHSMNGGVWMSTEHRMELLTTLLFAYEYVVQEMMAARSSADPCLITGTRRPADDEAFEALDQD